MKMSSLLKCRIDDPRVSSVNTASAHYVYIFLDAVATYIHSSGNKPPIE
jgi:hypothetical protein